MAFGENGDNMIDYETLERYAEIHVPIRSIAKKLEKRIFNSNLREDNKVMLLKTMLDFIYYDVNILMLGATGAGKSSTINALFDAEVAEIGVTPDPETSQIEKFELGHLVLWDSPGFGDNIETDKKNASKLAKLLKRKNDEKLPLINIILVVVDASSKDLGSTYLLLENIIIPHLQKGTSVIVGLNQADMAMKGRHWDKKLNVPDKELQNFLEEKSRSVKNRMHESTNIDLEVVYYAAGYKNPGKKQAEPYNLPRLLYCLLANFPKNSDDAEEKISDDDKEILDTLCEMINDLEEMDQMLNEFEDE